MGWVRANARLTGMVALVALAIQFASSFGHFHHEWIGQPEAAHAEAADHAGYDHDHHDHDRHDGKTTHRCPICIAASFTQGFTPPSAPVLPALIAQAASTPAPMSAAATASRVRGPFQSRAPPLA